MSYFQTFYENFEENPTGRVRIATIKAILGENEENKKCKFKGWLSKILDRDIEVIRSGGQSYVKGFSNKNNPNSAILEERDDYIIRLKDKIKQQEHQLIEQEHKSSMIINTLKNRLQDCFMMLRKKGVIIESNLDTNQKWDIGNTPPVIIPLVSGTYQPI